MACVAATILPPAQAMSVTLVTAHLRRRQRIGLVLDVVEREFGDRAGAVDGQDDAGLGLERLQRDIGLARRGIDGELANLDVLGLQAELAGEDLIDVGDLGLGPGGRLGVAGLDGDDLGAAADQQQAVGPERDGFDRRDLGIALLGLDERRQSQGAAGRRERMNASFDSPPMKNMGCHSAMLHALFDRVGSIGWQDAVCSNVNESVRACVGVSDNVRKAANHAAKIECRMGWVVLTGGDRPCQDRTGFPLTGSSMAPLAGQANGTAPRANPPVHWDAKKNIKWKAELPGRGIATPIVWNDQVFIVDRHPHRQDRSGRGLAQG